jgi:hypothetical protein
VPKGIRNTNCTCDESKTAIDQSPGRQAAGAGFSFYIFPRSSSRFGNHVVPMPHSAFTSAFTFFRPLSPSAPAADRCCRRHRHYKPEAPLRHLLFHQLFTLRVLHVRWRLSSPLDLLGLPSPPVPGAVRCRHHASPSSPAPAPAPARSAAVPWYDFVLLARLLDRGLFSLVLGIS